MLQKWFRGLRGRLLILILIPFFSLSVLVALVAWSSKNVDHFLHVITEVRMTSIKGLELMNEGQTAVAYSLSELMGGSSDPESLQVSLNRLSSKMKQIEEGYKIYLPLPQTEDEAIEWKTTELTWKEWTRHVENIQKAFEGNKKELLNELYQKQVQSYRPAEESLGKIIAINYKNSEQDRAMAESSLDQLLSLTTTTGAIAILVAIVFGFTMAIQTSASLTSLATVLSDSSHNVSSASHQISSSSELLASAASEQAASLEETVATMEELTSMVTRNAKDSEVALKLSRDTQTASQKGEAEVNALVHSIGLISADSKKIEHITGVIDDIAFQINLLALNAAVEAARAGEQGKGFAVVAEAVRTLAQKSAVASKEIAELIKGSVEKIARGGEQAESSGKVFVDIRSRVDQLVALVESIATASEEQAKGLVQINQSMNQMDQVTQQNAAQSEEAASSSVALSDQARNLNKAVIDLVLTIDGAKDSRLDRAA